MNTKMVNNILIRKDVCNLFKGMQVRHNLTKLEQWATDKKLDLKSVLLECIQISQLLQIDKTQMDHVDSIFETCTSLNSLQLQKIL